MRGELARGDHVSAEYTKVSFKFVDAIAARKRLKDGGVAFGALSVLFLDRLPLFWLFFLGAGLGYAQEAAGNAFRRYRRPPSINADPIRGLKGYVDI